MGRVVIETNLMLGAMIAPRHCEAQRGFDAITASPRPSTPSPTLPTSHWSSVATLLYLDIQSRQALGVPFCTS